MGDRIGYDVVFGEKIQPGEAAGLADVERWGEMVGGGELILGEAPTAGLGTEGVGEAGIVLEEVEQAEGVVAVLLEDCGAGGAGGVRVVPILPGEAEADG